jgi:peptidoglycan-N-acetylglucosamine deacetylase
MQGLRAAFLSVALLAAGGAAAAECPGNPDALGTSRTIVVDPVEHPRLGGMQYRESLPLADHEVVLTFDDNPLPPRTIHVLDTLASECVKATFFLVGKMATNYPGVVHKIAAAGHTIGTHSQTHPLRRRCHGRRLDEDQPGSGVFAGAAGYRGQWQGHLAAPC